VRRVLSPLLALLMAGCATHPADPVPRSGVARQVVAAAPFLGQGGAATNQADVPAHWWRLYEDPRLDSYVEEALAANTDLRAADANLRRASAIVREAQAGRTLSTGVSGQALGARTAGPTGALPSSFSYALGFDLSYPLDLGGGLRRGVAAASAQAEASVAARDHVRVAIAAAVTRNYARVCASNAALASARKIAQVQQSTLDAAIRMARGGRGARFDIDRARAAAYASDAAIPGILAEKQAALFELAALMGRAPADYPKEAEGCGDVPAVERPIPIGDGVTLLKRRPDVRMAERDLARATTMIGVRAAELYPSVSIGGSAGTAGPMKDLLAPSTFGFGLGPLVSWTFPNRKAVRARIDQAGAEADAALASFDGSVLLALQQTETALSAYARAREHLKALESAAAAAGKASDDAEKLQRFGRAPFLDVLQAQASYAQTLASLSAARANLVDRQIDLFLALGGGWE